MKKCKGAIGIGILASGVSLILAFFLPASVMVCIEALLLIAAGLLIFAM